MTYKKCPRCQQPAVMDMQQCQRCGHLYRQAGYQPIPHAPTVEPSPARRVVLIALGVGLLVFALLAFTVYSGTRPPQRPFFGVWYEPETRRTYTFNPDGTGSMGLDDGSLYHFRWYNTGNVLTTEQPQDGTPKVWAFPRAIWGVSDDGQHLMLQEDPTRTHDLVRR